jgi:alpha/beta superfamily hydrolase
MFCCFDFSGSGVSEGEYVSLGVFETEDTLCVIKYLKSLGYVNNIGLWGRSMGAVTSIKVAVKSPDV